MPVPASPSLTLALEALPYETAWWRVADWCGQRIRAKTALPLLRDTEHGPQPLAAATTWHDPSYRHWRLTLAAGLCWDDGSPLTAADYLRTIRRICRDPGNRFRTLLSDLDGFAAYTRGESERLGVHCPAIDSLAFDLTQANRFFAHLLCAIALSPLHADDGERSAGPYRLLGHNAERYLLGLNPHFSLEPAASAYPALHYRRDRSDGTAAAYARGEVDVSAETALAYPLYAAAARCHDFHRRHDGMILLLAAGSRFAELPERLRHELARLSDRHALRHHLYNVPAIAASYCPGDRPAPTGEAPVARFSDERVSVAYEDFYPNRQIVEELRRQWARYGVRLEPVAERYGQRITTTQLRLEIRVSLKSTPLLFYRADLARGLLPAAAGQRARVLYSHLLAGSGTDDSRLYAGLDRLLQEHGIAIPLLRMPQGLFVRDGIAADSVHRVGGFIHAS
jgi:hypothetical protein